MPHSRPCILYARKSTDREDKQILSIPAQLAELREFAARQGLIITTELTENCSAREPGRPVFSKILEDVAAGRVERILAWKLDRLARNPIDGGALIHYLGKGHLKELVTPEGAYSGTGDSKFMLSVLFGAATKMTDDLSAGVTRGNKAIHQSGRITGAPPIGYIKVRDKRGFRGAGKVVPDPVRFPIVQRMWKEVASGTVTMADAWRRATRQWGLTVAATTNKPERAPSLAYVYPMFENRFYAGEVVRRGVVYPGEHAPMISVEEFERVQSILHRRDRHHPIRHHFLFAGLLHCGACGRLFTGERIKGRYVYYRCGRRRDGFPRCNAPAPTEAEVSGDVERAVGRLALSPRLAEWTRVAVDLAIEHEGAHVDKHRARIQCEIDTLVEEQRRLTDYLLSGTVTEDVYRERQEQSRRKLAALERAVADPRAALDAWRADVAECLSIGSLTAEALRHGTQDESRMFLGRLYENFVVNERITRPFARFPFVVLEENADCRPLLDFGDENWPPPSDFVDNLRKNARPRGPQERAFQRWCSRDDSNV